MKIDGVEIPEELLKEVGLSEADIRQKFLDAGSPGFTGTGGMEEHIVEFQDPKIPGWSSVMVVVTFDVENSVS